MTGPRMSPAWIAGLARIPTTHVGSLPRPPEVLEALEARTGDPARESRFNDVVQSAVADVVGKQTELGVDLVSDGEMSKTGFSRYITECLSGFGGGGNARFVAGDLADLSGEELDGIGTGSTGVGGAAMLECVGEVAVRDRRPLQRDLANFEAALAGRQCLGGFVPSVTLGTIAFNFPNRHYQTHDVVTERSERFAGVVGRDRVIAGVDCGFGMTVGRRYLPRKLVWMKLSALVEGARRASERLWR